jgi:hypothetical protein
MSGGMRGLGIDSWGEPLLKGEKWRTPGSLTFSIPPWPVADFYGVRLNNLFEEK